MASQLESPEMQAFGARLRELRKERGLSQEQLSELAGLHRTYIGGIERGVRNVGLVNVHAIAGALGVGVAALFPPSSAGPGRSPG